MLLTIHGLRVVCFPVYIGVHRGTKPGASSSDLTLVKFLLWRALQQKFYRQDCREVDHLKCVLLRCRHFPGHVGHLKQT